MYATPIVGGVFTLKASATNLAAKQVLPTPKECKNGKQQQMHCVRTITYH